MRFIGFSRKQIKGTSDLSALLGVLERLFRTKTFHFTLEDGTDDLGGPPFTCERAAVALQEQNWAAFGKQNLVRVWVDNQIHSDPYFTYPYSTVEVDMTSAGPSEPLPTEELLGASEMLVEGLGLELAVALGNEDNAGLYWRTPLGVGIGLIKVFWIMSFGVGYSRLIAPQGNQTNFFKRHEFGPLGCKAFVSTATHREYMSAPPQLLESQRHEIGDDLFNRFPTEQRRGGAEAYSILDPRVLFKFAASLIRHRLRNWRKYQAKVVPHHYAKPARRWRASDTS